MIKLLKSYFKNIVAYSFIPLGNTNNLIKNPTLYGFLFTSNYNAENISYFYILLIKIFKNSEILK